VPVPMRCRVGRVSRVGGTPPDPGSGSNGARLRQARPPDQLRLEDLLLLDADDTDAVPIDS